MSGHANVLDISLDESGRFANSEVVPSEDWYSGHKVVAMPSSAFGGMSIREVVSSRNESSEQQQTQHQATNSRPRRSSSLGRQPVIRPGRDIVQDVYDRMGVSYSRGINYETTPPTSQTGGFVEDHQVNANAPTGMIQTTASFSEVSDFTANTNTSANNNANAISSGGQPHPGLARAAASGKIKDKFSGRYRAAAAISRSTPDRGAGRTNRPETSTGSRGRATEPRGRSAAAPEDQPESEGQRRARSLSRGLSVRGKWPPTKDQAMDNNNNAPASNKSLTNTNAPVGYTSTTAESCRNEALPQQRQQAPPPPNRPMSPLKRSHSFDARPQYGGGFRSTRTPQPQTTDGMMINGRGMVREEKKESDDRSAVSEVSGADEVSSPTLPSVKDRMRAFAGNGKSNSTPRTAPRRNTYTAAAPPPPKVDIYEKITNNMVVSHYHPDDPNAYEEDEVQVVVEEYAIESSVVPPSAAATAAAETAAKYMRPSQVVLSKQQQKAAAAASRSSRIASSYLNGIQSSSSVSSSNTKNTAASRSCFSPQQPQQQPMTSDAPSATEDNTSMNNGFSTGTGGDGNSVGATSAASWQKPASHHTQTAVATKSNNAGSSSNNGVDVSMETIERMVDERVQVQLREVESRMEGLLRRWMDSMNTKITSRLDAMEQSIKDTLPRQEI